MEVEALAISLTHEWERRPRPVRFSSTALFSSGSTGSALYRAMEPSAAVQWLVTITISIGIIAVRCKSHEAGYSFVCLFQYLSTLAKNTAALLVVSEWTFQRLTWTQFAAKQTSASMQLEVLYGFSTGWVHSSR